MERATLIEDKTRVNDYLNVRLRDISRSIRSIHQKALIIETFFQLIEEELDIVPVVNDEGLVVGQINRAYFIEHIILGKYGYGIHLNGRKFIYQFMESPKYVFESDSSIEDVSIKLKDMENLPKNIIVTKEGRVVGAVLVSSILELLAQKTLMLMKDANPLTGMPGNWAIKREIERRISAGEVFEVIYIDMNNFKPFNDRYGFAKGDEVILILGEIIKEETGKYQNTFAGHIGGDDFVIICPRGLSWQLAEEIKKKFELRLPDLHGEDYKSGFYLSKDRSGVEKKFPLLSLSFAIVSNEHRNIKSYAQLASIATEVKTKAKLLSREEQSSIIFKDRRTNELDLLSLSFPNIVIEMYFQPVVDLNSYTVIGFEALVRGVDSRDNKLISPKTLFEIAKKEDMLLEFDRLCRDLALKKFKDFGLEKDFLIFLNVSAEIVDLSLVGTGWMKKRVEYYGITPDHVVVEVSESKIQNTENLISFVEKYRNLGFSIALDDFGTKESNLERLLLVKPNYIKLAKNFVEGVHENKNKQKLLEVMKFLSEKFNAPIILEGIEAKEEALYVKHQGIRFAQGYLFSPPQSNPKEALKSAQDNLKNYRL